jgi:hypothetical protein
MVVQIPPTNGTYNLLILPENAVLQIQALSDDARALTA